MQKRAGTYVLLVSLAALSVLVPSGRALAQEADPNPPELVLYGANEEQGWDGYYHDAFFENGITPTHGVYPARGTIDTIFEFLVQYTDADGDAPRNYGAGYDHRCVVIGPGGSATSLVPAVPPDYAHPEGPSDGNPLYALGVPYIAYFKPSTTGLYYMSFTTPYIVDPGNPPDDPTEYGLVSTGLVSFMVYDSTPTLIGVDETGATPFPGFSGLVADPGKLPDYYDGSASSIYTFRAKYQGTFPPYGWKKYAQDTWVDPRPYDIIDADWTYWDYHEQDASPWLSFEPGPHPAPMRYSRGVVLYLDGSPHHMEVDSSLPPYKTWDELEPADFATGVVFKYVIDPNSFETNLTEPVPPDMPPGQMLGRRYNSGYASLNYGQHQFLYATADDYQSEDAIQYNSSYQASSNFATHRFEKNYSFYDAAYPYQHVSSKATDFSTSWATQFQHPMVEPVLKKGFFRPNRYEAEGVQGFPPASRAVAGTAWQFYVTYYGQDGRNPYVAVWVDGTEHRMSQVGADPFSSGALFKYVDTTLGPSSTPHTVWWTADDGTASTYSPRRPDDDPWGIRTIAEVGNDHGDWWIDSLANFDSPNDPDTVASGFEPRVNIAPTITNPSVSPTSGPPGTTFLWKATYTDTDVYGPQPALTPRNGDPPYAVNMYIVSPELGGKYYYLKVNMDKSNPADSNYADGCAYQFSANKIHQQEVFTSHNGGEDVLGTYYYCFEFVDNWASAPNPEEGEHVTLPENVTLPTDPEEFPDQDLSYLFEGPTIGGSRPPTLEPITVTPSQGAQATDDPATAGTTFEYRVTYTQDDDVGPKAGYPKLVYYPTADPSDKETKTMLPDPGNDGDYTNGEEYFYRKTFPSADDADHSWGSYSFYIDVVMNDSFDTESTSAVQSGPRVRNRPNLSDGAVDPADGNEGTAFSFDVVYTDLLNLAPSNISLSVRRWNGSAYESQGVYQMVKQDSGDTDYTDGATYIYPQAGQELNFSEEVGGKPYLFYFTSNDGVKLSYCPFLGDSVPTDAELETEGFLFHVRPNHAPVLLQGDVEPDTGNLQEGFEYKVRYRDPDNNPPETIQVDIDGTLHDMTLDTENPNYVLGAWFVYVPGGGSLARDTAHTYHFEASDGLESARFPTTDGEELDGPTVENAPPVLSSGDVAPDAGSGGTYFTYTVTYTDADGDAPASGWPKLFIDGATEEADAFTMTRSAGQGTDYAAGVQYEYVLLGSALGGDPSGTAHTFEIQAKDSYTSDQKTATPVDGTGPTVVSSVIDPFSVSPDTVELGSAVTVSGTLTSSASVADQTIYLAYKRGSVQSNRTAKTDSSGAFTDTFVPSVPGDWTVTASWTNPNDADDAATAEGEFKAEGVTSGYQYYGGRYYMISAPLVPTDGVPSTFFGDQLNDMNLYAYLPTQMEYVRYNTNPAGFPSLGAGMGFWIRPLWRTDEQYGYSPFGTVVDQTATYNIPLSSGWNIFGSLYFTPIWFSGLRVRYGDQTVSLQQAISNKWVRGYLWTYNGTGYDMLDTASGQILPWVGYWMRAYVDCVLVLDPTARSMADDRAAGPTSGRATAPSADEWSLRLSARAEDYADAFNFIGVTSDADRRAIESPGYPGEYVDLYFVGDATRAPEGSRLASQMYAEAAPEMEWDFEVATDQQNSKVVLSWPDIARTPRDYSFVLTDVDSKKSVFMRTRTQYSYNSGQASGPRRFKITASSGSAGALMITGLSCQSARGSTTVAYNLSRDAEITIKIYDLRGKAIRTLTAGEPEAKGLSQRVWDGKDSRGRLVSRGTYIVEVRAQTETGQATRAVVPVALGR
jgi:hypothetical protein